MLVILLKKSGYDTKIKDIKNKYISTTKFNKLATDAVNAQIALNPRIDHYDMSKIRIKFDGSFLNRFPATILHGNIVNIYIVYEITCD